MDYSLLVKAYEELESTSKRMEKTGILIMFFREHLSDLEEFDKLVLLLQGRVFAPWDERKVGMASQLVLKSISMATGVSIPRLESSWKESGDLGEVVAHLASKGRQSTLFSRHLTVRKVFDNLRNASGLSGKGTVSKKVQLVTELLTSATPAEAKYVVRTVLEDLRVGIGEGIIRDAIAWAALFGDRMSFEGGRLLFDSEEAKASAGSELAQASELVQEAYDRTNDMVEVARIALKKGKQGLREVSIRVGKPVKVMLYPKASSVEDAFNTVGRPAAIEFKYDGFRIQVHKEGEKIRLFTRRLEEVTEQFPDVVSAVKSNISAKTCILDGEAVGFDPKSGKYLPFQSISQRIRRKYDIASMAKRFPVEYVVFDLIHIDGKDITRIQFKDRRKKILKILNPVHQAIVPAKQLITGDDEEAGRFYQEALDAQEEGVMFKSLSSAYKPGARVGYGIKLKPVMESLDLVIIGAEWGEGKRANWLTSFTLACRNEDGSFLEIGKVGTGLKEKDEEGLSFNQVTELLRPYIHKEKGREVAINPAVVLEINYEEIQKSPTYASGYALRFPRVVRLRDDKGPDDASSIKQVEELYEGQRAS